MTLFTLEDLRKILGSADGTDGPELDENSLDVAFVELGYDSLAMLELAASVARQYEVPIPDDSLEHMTTPRTAVAYLNERLVASGKAA
ncbi:acyl carrier protein [Micromonospora sp. LOL_021]|uniref:acyl carrier protein n=1 Tax=Micromonospora sp. LOL_021 TaxID=3345417 RepID=UPI003A8C24DC